MKQLLNSKDLGRREIESLIKSANKFASGYPTPKDFSKKIVGILFFEESTRTRLGFEAATHRLGAQTISMTQTKLQARMSAAESIEDTVRVLDAYCDILCIRHKDAEIFKSILPHVTKPLVNCGNGPDEHPSQVLLDLMTISNLRGKIDGLRIALVGDLRFMRAPHSLLLGLSRFKNTHVRCVSPKLLRMPKEYKDAYEASGNKIEETEFFNIADMDVVYMVGLAPITPIKNFSAAVRARYQLNKRSAQQLRPDAIVLCPLPRIDEITTDIDQLPQAKYFKQNEYSLFMRMAIINDLLKIQAR